MVSLFTRLDIRNIGEQILKYKNIPYTSIDKLTYNILSYITIGSWNLYALVHILHKLDIISIYYTLIYYIVLDVLSKGIFTYMLLGSKIDFIQRIKLIQSAHNSKNNN